MINGGVLKDVSQTVFKPSQPYQLSTCNGGFILVYNILIEDEK